VIYDPEPHCLVTDDLVGDRSISRDADLASR